MLDARRKRILFRSTHRGTKEADWLVGGFAQAEVATLDEDMLDRLEALLDVLDSDLVAWITGRTAPDPEHDTPLIARMRHSAHLRTPR